jgi:hypothetical protein
MHSRLILATCTLFLLAVPHVFGRTAKETDDHYVNSADPRATETEALTETLFREMRKANVNVGVGRYDEARLLYVSPLFGQGEVA